MTHYTDEDVRVAAAAIAPMFGDGVVAAPEVQQDRLSRAILDAVAPAIAARALREAARDRRELLLCAPDASALDRRADEIAP